LESFSGSVFKPAGNKEKHVTFMLNQVIEWSEAMKSVRTHHAAVAS
jgi:hypothetical protein